MRHIVKKFTHDGLRIELTYKTMKNLRMTVPDGSDVVRISAPHHTPLSAVEEFIAIHRAWIDQRQARSPRSDVLERAVIRNGQIRILGNWTPLAALGVTGLESPTRLDEVLRDVLAPEVERLSRRYRPLLGVSPAGLRYRRMKSRWGSCSQKTRIITLNIALAQAPARAIEYVLVHELVHLRVPNHGPHFRALMDQTLPNWKALNTELDQWQSACC